MKKIALILTIGALTSTMLGCGGKGGSTAATTTTTTTTTTAATTGVDTPATISVVTAN